MIDWDEISKEFIWIIGSDPDLDYRLGRILLLFAVDMPEMSGGYCHHGQTI